VVGAGFAGLTAVRKLARSDIDILVLDRHNYHLFTPLLYQVASALLDPSEIAQPVRSLLRGLPNVGFRLATATGVDLAAKVVMTDRGRLDYDYLILAAGSVSNFFGSLSLERQSYPLKELDQALEIRDRVLGRFEQAQWERDPARRAELLTFVIVGGGPTGVEYAGALSELVRLVLRRDCRDLDPGDARIVLVEGGDRLLATFPADLSKYALRTLEKRAIEVWLGTLAKSADEHGLDLSDGRRIESRTIVWSAGVRAGRLSRGLGPAGPGGTVKVLPTLQLAGHPEAFVIGDMADVEAGGGHLPMLAAVAMQEAESAARSIRALVRGGQPTPFRYRDKGIMATIGRNAGVAQIGGLHLRGFVGWLAWLGVHLLLILSLRSKFLVLVNWSWDYFFYDRPVRFILGAGGSASAERAPPTDDG